MDTKELKHYKHTTEFLLAATITRVLQEFHTETGFCPSTIVVDIEHKTEPTPNNPDRSEYVAVPKCTVSLNLSI